MIRFKNWLIITFLILGIGCGNKTQHLGRGCNEFEFKNLNRDTNKWREENSLEEISDPFFKENISKFKGFSNKDPKSFFYVCEISVDNLDGYVIAELNGPTWDMYFIPKSEGKVLLLACTEVSINEYRITKSRLVNKSLEMTTIYFNDEEKIHYQDSIVSRYEIRKPSEFVRVQADSVRILLK